MKVKFKKKIRQKKCYYTMIVLRFSCLDNLELFESACIQLTLVYLSHYCTMPHFEALKICSSAKHCEKMRNCLLQAIAPFQNVSYPIWHLFFSLNALKNDVCNLSEFGSV